MHVTLKPDTKVNTKVRPEGARLLIDAAVPIESRLQNLPQGSDIIDLTPATTGKSHPNVTGPKLWNL